MFSSAIPQTGMLLDFGGKVLQHFSGKQLMSTRTAIRFDTTATLISPRDVPFTTDLSRRLPIVWGLPLRAS